MIDIHFSGKAGVHSYQLPENYNDLTERQICAISKLFLSQLPADVARLEAMRILLGKKRLSFFRMSSDVKQRLLEHIEWVFERNGLTRQLLPVYRRFFFSRAFYGPASDWDNLTMGEWSACEVYYEWMINDRHDMAVEMLIAVLYRCAKKNYDRKRDPDGDIRVPYNHHETLYWANKIRHWPLEVKTSILTWYDGCREMVINSYDVFEDGTSEQDKKAPGMFEVIRGLCGDRYGSFEAVEKMDVHKALSDMELTKQEAERIKNIK